MGTLTGQQINNTYDGLLKLSDSTTGITSNFQAIEDGLGNNTGLRIRTNFLTGPNLVNLNHNLVPDMMGTGFGAAASPVPIANSQNRVLYNIFYDPGVYAYSAISYNVNTLTSTSDVVTMAFYTMQLVPAWGYAPKDLVMSGITLVSNSTGKKTTSLPSNLSFSGTGGGYYVFAVTYSNANVTPTVRYTTMQNGTINQSFSENLGFYLNAAGTNTSIGSRIGSQSNTNWLQINNLSFQNSFSESDIINNLNSTAPAGCFGFGLEVVR